jgi:TolA-binding protein
MIVRAGIFCLGILAAARCSNVAVTENKVLHGRNRDLLRRASESEIEVKRLEKIVAKGDSMTSLSDRAPEEVPKVSVQVLKPENFYEPQPSEDSSEGTLLASSDHEEMTWYYRGLAEIGAGKYDQAAKAFSEFLVLSPEHIYADRAQYWIGEAYFRSGENGLCLVADNAFMLRYPESFRAPEVMYRAALTHLRMGRRATAEEVLREILHEHPSGSLNKQATQKLMEIVRSKRG